MVISNYVGRIVTVTRVIRILDVAIRDIALFGDLGKIAIASAAAGLLTNIVRPLLVEASPLMALVVCGVWFVAVYATTLLATGILTPDERVLIHNAVLHVTGRSPHPLIQG